MRYLKGVVERFEGLVERFGGRCSAFLAKKKDHVEPPFAQLAAPVLRMGVRSGIRI